MGGSVVANVRAQNEDAVSPALARFRLNLRAVVDAEVRCTDRGDAASLVGPGHLEVAAIGDAERAAGTNGTTVNASGSVSARRRDRAAIVYGDGARTPKLRTDPEGIPGDGCDRELAAVADAERTGVPRGCSNAMGIGKTGGRRDVAAVDDAKGAGVARFPLNASNITTSGANLDVGGVFNAQGTGVLRPRINTKGTGAGTGCGELAAVHDAHGAVSPAIFGSDCVCTTG